jgi:hypothetical protein
MFSSCPGFFGRLLREIPFWVNIFRGEKGLSIRLRYGYEAPYSCLFLELARRFEFYSGTVHRVKKALFRRKDQMSL